MTKLRAIILLDCGVVYAAVCMLTSHSSAFEAEAPSLSEGLSGKMPLRAGEGCPSDVRVLAQALHSQKAKDRAKAARQIATLGPRASEAVPHLIALLTDQTQPENERLPVSGEAFEALGRIGGPAVPALIEALNLPGVDRVAILLTLTYIRDRRAVPAAVRLLEDADPEVREYSASLLKTIPDPSASAALIRRLKDSNKYVVLYALTALGEIREKHAVEPLMAMVRDQSSPQRDQAALSLGLIADPAAFSLLLEVAANDNTKLVRCRALLGLGEFGDPRALDTVRRALKSSEPEERGSAIMALEKLEDPRLVELLLPILADTREGPQSIPLRYQAGRVLAHQDSEEAIAAVCDQIQAEPLFRRTGYPLTNALAESPHARGYQRAILALQGSDIRVRNELVRFLAHTVSYKFVATVGPAEDAAMRTFAIHKDPRIVAPLIAIAEDPTTSEETRSQAIASLRKTGDPRANQFVERIPESSISSVRHARTSPPRILVVPLPSSETNKGVGTE